MIEAYFGDSTVYYHDIPHYTKEEIYHSMEVVKMRLPDISTILIRTYHRRGRQQGDEN